MASQLTTVRVSEPEAAAFSEPAADRPKISIVIPAFNEEEGIAQTLQSLCSEPYLKGAEIIVVDDGSADRTGAVVASFPQIKLIRHPFNRGYGSAICTGARAAHGEYIFWFDSDGQHRVEDLIRVCRELIDGEMEYCIGVREQTSYQDPNRKLGKWLLRQAVNFSMGQSVPDFNSGLRGFRRDVLLRYLHLLPKGFGASTLTTLLMIEGNHYGTTVPILVKPRVGKSTVKQFRDGFRTLQIILHIVILFKPLKFFGLLGSLFILMGFVYGFIKASVIHLGFPTFAAVLITLGVQSFFFGLLCDQISAMRREKFSQ
jgi:glycosyltransferase involved in cell wall biosynthesis